MIEESNVLPLSEALVTVCGTLSLFVHSATCPLATEEGSGLKAGLFSADAPGRIEMKADAGFVGVVEVVWLVACLAGCSAALGGLGVTSPKA